MLLAINLTNTTLCLSTEVTIGVNSLQKQEVLMQETKCKK